MIHLIIHIILPLVIAVMKTWFTNKISEQYQPYYVIILSFPILSSNKFSTVISSAKTFRSLLIHRQHIF